MEMVNRGKINKGQVNVLVKWLKVVVVYKIFYKSKPWGAKNKGFRTYVNSKGLTLNILKYRITIQL